MELNGRKALNLRYLVRLVLLIGLMTALLTMRKLRSSLFVAEAESCFIEFLQFFNPFVSCHPQMFVLILGETSGCLLYYAFNAFLHFCGL